MASVGEKIGETLASSEQEMVIIDRAAAAADRAEELQRLWDLEVTGERSSTLLVKLSGEMRACEKAVIDLVSRLSFLGPAKLERHQRAANSRHQRNAAAQESAGNGMRVVH